MKAGTVLGKIKEYIGIIAIVIAFAAAAVVVALNNITISRDVNYTVQPGDTVASIAKAYSTTVQKIVDINYPDVTENSKLTVGASIRIPKGAQGKTITVRIAHWQLEPGVRDGIIYMAKEYQKLHPNVVIAQNAVPETTYNQWFTTQMVGGTPADLMELGKVAQPLMVTYYMRYFVPLTEYVTQPNPYNKNNEFAGVSLRDTTKDGLKNAYIPEVQEYMGIGLSQFLVRMYYNKTLLSKLAGYTNAPKDWREFMDACEKISAHQFISKPNRKILNEYAARIQTAEKKLVSASADQKAVLEKEIAECRTKSGELLKIVPKYVPIANSQYQMGAIENNMFNVMTSKARQIIDFNHDCTVDFTEVFIGFKTKKVSFNYPPYRARFALVSNFTKHCIPGFVGLNRDDGVLLFVQQRGIFLSTGTWDAQMLEEQAKDNGFDVGIMEFPIPSKDDPEYGQFVEGPAFEDPATGFMFGCPTPESAPERRKAAIDFMLFMSSKENNIKLNEMIGWIPCVKGVEGVGILKYFQPHADGVMPGFNVNIGGETTIKWQQMYALYQVGQISYEKLAAEFEPFYLERGLKDYFLVSKNWRRSVIIDEKNLASLRAKAFLAGKGPRKDEYWSKYRYVMLRPVGNTIGTSYTRALMKSAEDKNFTAPDAYEYSDVAKRRLRRI
ncbi:MAG: extracellular solute-binding protein [Spirochaetota bacterium]